MFLISAAAHPLVRTILSGDGADDLLRLFTTRGSAVLRRTVAQLTDVLLEGWPQVQRADIEPFAECMVRLAVSLASMPDSPSALSAQVISQLFTPFVERILAVASTSGNPTAASGGSEAMPPRAARRRAAAAPASGRASAAEKRSARR